jgi:hypothetical protein
MVWFWLRETNVETDDSVYRTHAGTDLEQKHIGDENKKVDGHDTRSLTLYRACQPWTNRGRAEYIITRPPMEAMLGANFKNVGVAMLPALPFDAQLRISFSLDCLSPLL